MFLTAASPLPCFPLDSPPHPTTIKPPAFIPRPNANQTQSARRPRARVQNPPRSLQQPVPSHRQYSRACHHPSEAAPAPLARSRTSSSLRSPHRVARPPTLSPPRTTPSPSHPHGLPRRKLAKVFRRTRSRLRARNSSSRITRHIAQTKPLKRSQPIEQCNPPKTTRFRASRPTLATRLHRTRARLSNASKVRRVVLRPDHSVFSLESPTCLQAHVSGGRQPRRSERWSRRPPPPCAQDWLQAVLGRFSTCHQGCNQRTLRQKDNCSPGEAYLLLRASPRSLLCVDSRALLALII